MQIDIQRLNRLPRQAWLTRYRNGAADAVVGEAVSLFDRGFFEGGWASTPGPEALRPSGIHLGSGAVWDAGKLTLISPSHTLESIWTAETDGATWAANSLALLVAAVRPQDLHIGRARPAMRSINKGLARYDREIHREPGLRICRFANAFVVLEGNDPPAERQQTQDAPFDSYETYVDFLTRAVREATESFGEGMSVYLSRGYDSPAAAAIGKRVGPVEAICIDRTASGSADDGLAIADALRIPSLLTRRRQRTTRVMAGQDWQLALEVISADDYEDVFEFFGGADIHEECMRAPDEAVANRAVLTGWYGDSMWGRGGEPWKDLERPHTSSGGTGLCEFRLRTGFMHIPVPALAFNHAGILRAISESDAMRPWRLGTDYDRPIPRRIVEESGVPRNAFGMEKLYTATKAANLHAVAPDLFAMQLDRYTPALEDWARTRRRPDDHRPADER